MPSHSNQVATKEKPLSRRALIGFRKFAHLMSLPKTKLCVRSSIVAILTVVNIVSVFTNLKEHPQHAIAFGVTTIVLVSCLSVILKVGYKSLAEQIREFEGVTVDPYAHLREREPDTDDEEPEENEVVDYLSTAAAANNKQSLQPKRANSDDDSSSSLATLNTVNDAEGRAAKNVSNNTAAPSLALQVVAPALDDTTHPLTRCFFRRHPNLLIPVGLVGFLASITAAIYYLVLAIEDGTEPTMTTMQNTLYMCFILYMVCGKWNMMIVLLMAKLRKEEKMVKDGSLFQVEAEEMRKMAEKRAENRAKRVAKRRGDGVAEGKVIGADGEAGLLSAA